MNSVFCIPTTVNLLLLHPIFKSHLPNLARNCIFANASISGCSLADMWIVKALENLFCISLVSWKYTGANRHVVSWRREAIE